MCFFLAFFRAFGVSEIWTHFATFFRLGGGYLCFFHLFFATFDVRTSRFGKVNYGRISQIFWIRGSGNCVQFSLVFLIIANVVFDLSGTLDLFEGDGIVVEL